MFYSLRYWEDCKINDKRKKNYCLLVHFLSINVIFTLMYVVMVSFQTLLKGNADWQKRRNFLSRQQTFIDKLVRLVKTVARESGNRKKKVCWLPNIVPRYLGNITKHEIKFALNTILITESTHTCEWNIKSVISEHQILWFFHWQPGDCMNSVISVFNFYCGSDPILWAN